MLISRTVKIALRHHQVDAKTCISILNAHLPVWRSPVQQHVLKSTARGNVPSFHRGQKAVARASWWSVDAKMCVLSWLSPGSQKMGSLSASER